MTRTITASPTMMMQHQAGSMKQTHIGGKQASSLDQSSLITSSSCLVFDELNTPEIGLTGFKFTDSHAYDTPPALLEDHPPATWGGGIPFNTNNEEQPLPEVLGWNTTPLAPQRPTELKLLIKLDHQEQQYKSVAARPTQLKLKMPVTPLPVMETPTVMDTPDVFHQFGDTHNFDLVNFVLNDKSSASPLDSPRVSSINVPLASILPAVKQEPPTYYEEVSPAQYVISSTTEPEDKFVPPSEIPSTSQEVLVPTTQDRKRRSSRRLSSLEQHNYEQSDDEDYSNSGSYKRFKPSGSIKEEFDDESSIAGSAAESKYSDMRVRNNEASRRSRQNRKQRETQMEREANALQATNVRLRTHVDKLEHLVLTMRKALLDSVNKANKK